MLVLGGVLMATGIFGVDIGAHHAGTGTDPWPLVPGLFVAGFGLSLLVIPLANVVLAAVPANVAGGASGIFSTVQQMGGAIGIAVFLAAAVLAVILPKTAVKDPAAGLG